MASNITLTMKAGLSFAQSDLGKVRAWRQAREHKILTEYFEFLSIPNFALDKDNILKNAEFIAGLLEKRGVKARLLPAQTPGAPPAVYGEVLAPGAIRTIVFYAQYDGQAVNPAQSFRPDEFFFQGHYPGHPLVPGVNLCESAMQAGAILLAQFTQQAEGVPVATRLNDVKLKRMIHPGDTIEMEVTLQERLADAFFLQAKVTCDGKVAVRFEFACTVAKVAE